MLVIVEEHRRRYGRYSEGGIAQRAADLCHDFSVDLQFP
jgi:hypothetical protein